MRNIPRIVFVAIFILLFALSANAQLKTPPVIEWQRSLGGSSDDYTQSVQQTSDGGYIVAGSPNSFDGDVNKVNNYRDYWVVKVSPTGMVQWKGLYGGNGRDIVSSIVETEDGAYIMAGTSTSFDVDVKDHIGSDDFWIAKLKDDSVISWGRSFGGRGYDQAACVMPTFEGGYIIVGSSNSIDVMVSDNHGKYDYWVVKLASNGIKEWSRSYGGSEDDYGTSIQQTTDSGYIIVGESSSNDGNITGHHGANGSTDCWVIKLSKEGNIEWQRSIGGSENDFAKAIRQTVDGGYIIVGYSASINGDVNGHFGTEGIYDMWVVKLTASGSIEWDRSLGGSNYDYSQSVCETTDSGYVVAGSTMSHDGNVSINHGESDYWLAKLSNTGILEWEKSFGGSNYDWANSVQETTDGGFIVAGYSKSNDGDVSGNHGDYDLWVVKLSPENPSSVESESAATQTPTITPNPATSSATLTLESDEEGICEVQIISVTGAILKQYSTRLMAGKQEIELTDLESLPSGMYEVLVKHGDYLVGQTKLIID